MAAAVANGKILREWCIYPSEQLMFYINAKNLGMFYGENRHTTRESERLVRLPMHYGLAESDMEKGMH